MSFKSLKLDDWLLNQLPIIGVKKPTEVQLHCIPEILKGRDCIGCDKTGSGKTLAFALPILQELSQDPYGIYALIITPTRELAFQIADQFKVLGKPLGFKDCIVVGGMDMLYQGIALAGKPHIVIGTPGRLADHLQNTDSFNLKKIRFLVLDEADRLLEGSYSEHLKIIFQNVNTKRQTLLFSATITETLKELQTIAMNKPFFWASESTTATVEKLDQRYVLVPVAMKDVYLVKVISTYMKKVPKAQVMIFTDTCKSCAVLTMMFRKLELRCLSLHGISTQKLRISALRKFKSSYYKILISTDVGSRGLDMPAVNLIVNHNVPSNPKDYVHRVGRTARAGREGVAITFVTPHDIGLLHAIEDLIKTKLKEHPTDDIETAPLVKKVMFAKRKAELKLEKIDFEEKRRLYRQKKYLEQGKDPVEEEKKYQKRREARLKAISRVDFISGNKQQRNTKLKTNKTTKRKTKMTTKLKRNIK